MSGTERRYRKKALKPAIKRELVSYLTAQFAISIRQSWSIDFMHDALVCGRRFRTFNVVDDFNREALAIEIDLNIPAQRVIKCWTG